MLPILITTENALASASLATVISASLVVNVYTGIDNDEKSAPAIICSCADATEDFIGSGVWHIKSSIIVKEIAFDTSVSSSLATTLFNKIIEMTPSQLSNCTSNYSVYDFWIDGNEQSQQDDAWIQTLNLEIVGVLT